MTAIGIEFQALLDAAVDNPRGFEAQVFADWLDEAGLPEPAILARFQGSYSGPGWAGIVIQCHDIGISDLPCEIARFLIRHRADPAEHVLEVGDAPLARPGLVAVELLDFPFVDGRKYAILRSRE